MAKIDVPVVVGREPVTDVRVQAGAVHWEGARVVTHISTSTESRGILGQHMLVADELTLHPVGVMVKIGAKTYIVPHARVETYKLA